MHNSDLENMVLALEQIGKNLADPGEAGSMTIVICGAMAGLLSGELSSSRVTLDCDVIVSEPEGQFAEIARVANEIGQELSLPPNWLNNDAKMYSHWLPLGWKSRTKKLGQYGPLSVLLVSRVDLVALKLMGIARRPQDLEDIDAINPTIKEIDFLLTHLDRLEAEDLDRRTFDLQREELLNMRRER